MRFKSLLPILQTVAMLLILWAPWTAREHEFAMRLTHRPAAIEWAEAINLPASAVVTPAEFAIRKPDALSNITVKFYGFWIVGLLCWCMVGRFIDDLIQWRRAKTLPR